MKIIKLILFLFAFASMLPLHAQLTKTEDSLKILLKKYTKADTTRLMLLIKLSTEIQACKPMEGIGFADEAIALCSRFQNPRAKIMAYLSKGYCYLTLANTDSAENIFQEALLISQKIQDKKLMVDSYNGICWNFKQNETARENIAKKSIELAKSIGYEFGQMQPNTTLFYINCGKDLKIATFYALNTLKIAEKYNSPMGLNWAYIEFSVINQYQNNFEKAESYGLKALREIEKIRDINELSGAYGNLGEIYNYWQKPEKAFYYYNLALIISEKYNLFSQLGLAYNNRGEIYKKLNKFDEALRDLKKSLYYHQRYFHTEVNSGLVYFNIGEISYLKKNYNSAIFNLEKALALCRKDSNMNTPVYTIRILEVLAKCYDGVKNYKKAEMTLWELYKATEYKFNTDKYKISNELTEKYQAEKKEKENQILKQKNEIQNLEIGRRSLISYILGSGFFVIILIATFTFSERKKSEKLLLNILPKKIAKRLKGKEKIIADHFEEASVIFIDIANFTKMSAASSPQNVVKELNKIFTTFDHIASKYGIEKIKTIGDCYMAAAGIPERRTDHADAIAQMATELMKTMKDYKTEEGVEIKFRIGMDCGPVVAGVIGEQKFIYDLWGDTVNTASRMESHGVAGKIQVTERLKDILTSPNPLLTKEETEDGVFRGWFFEERGEIEIKGKGKMKTWFLN